MPSSLDALNQRGTHCLPGHLDIRILESSPGKLVSEFSVQSLHMAPNGYLHAGSVVTLADASAGYGCTENLPEGASSFTTIELKSNHLGTARSGTVRCVAKMVHGGRTTQVCDAEVTHVETGITMRCFGVRR